MFTFSSPPHVKLQYSHKYNRNFSTGDADGCLSYIRTLGYTPLAAKRPNKRGAWPQQLILLTGQQYAHNHLDSTRTLFRTHTMLRSGNPRSQQLTRRTAHICTRSAVYRDSNNTAPERSVIPGTGSGLWTEHNHDLRHVYTAAVLLPLNFLAAHQRYRINDLTVQAGRSLRQFIHKYGQAY